jgi:hypothetical protein
VRFIYFITWERTQVLIARLLQAKSLADILNNNPTTMTHLEILKKVEWRDLKNLSFKEMLIENNLTIPWFLISLTLAYFGYYILALPFSAFFFLTGLRQVHNGFHNSLGTNKILTWLSLYINSILMMTSIHAVKFNHIRHHKYCLTDEDYEGKSAGMTWYGAILYGPIHMFLIHKVTLQIGNKDDRRNVILELVSIAIFAVVRWSNKSGHKSDINLCTHGEEKTEVVLFSRTLFLSDLPNRYYSKRRMAKSIPS